MPDTYEMESDDTIAWRFYPQKKNSSTKKFLLIICGRRNAKKLNIEIELELSGSKKDIGQGAKEIFFLWG